MQMRSWDPEELIYFKNSFISFANELLGIPRPPQAPYKEISDFVCK